MDVLCHITVTMGMTVSMIEIEKHQGKICMPNRPYIPFPGCRKGAVGKVCQYYHAKPPSKFIGYSIQHFLLHWLEPEQTIFPIHVLVYKEPIDLVDRFER